MMPINEPLARAIVSVSDVFSTIVAPDNNFLKWFVSFGALLYYVRDLQLGKKFEGDLDISVMYGDVDRDELVQRFGEYGYELEYELLDNYNNKPLQMTFKPDNSFHKDGFHVDVFFWFKHKQSRYHTYDVLMETP